ncbi:GGDEF domain-containing protein [Streptomyces sp. NPDC001698]|uniref:GGDEF domain-containing protein n=1 Tax=Streptomyces sp. NPDC001698 TaxID=3364601 RepID=UPI0036C63D0B
MVDADHFKAVNDPMGHAAGDAVVAAYGARLTAWAGPRAAAGRLGGDEFAVALELPAGRREQRLEQLVRILHTPVVLDDGSSIDVAVSVGAATPDMVGSKDLTVLQRAADAALYDGKHSDRDTSRTPRSRPPTGAGQAGRARPCKGGGHHRCERGNEACAGEPAESVAVAGLA